MTNRSPLVNTARDVAPPSTHRASITLFMGFILLFLSTLAQQRVLGNTTLFWSFLGAAFALLLGFGSLLFLARKPLSFERSIRLPHLVQACVQFGVFLYWGTAWEQVGAQAGLIWAQIIFAYGCDALFSWRRYRHWRLGFGPIPVVLSTNLFLWFVDDYFALQFVMIFLAYFSRDVICITREGKRSHLFNPSAFALSIAAIGLIAFKVPELTYGADIAQTLGSPDFPYVWIFLMGFVVQGFFRVTMVTLSAALAMVCAGMLYTAVYDTFYYIDTAIPIAVFLGMNLLITDPATSPRSTVGRLTFGVFYGVLVFVSYDLLRQFEAHSLSMGTPLNISWSDKLLCVPILNLLAKPIDRMVAGFERGALAKQWVSSNRVHMLLWCLGFMVIYPRLVTHPGNSVSVWESACEQNKRRACEDKLRLYLTRCANGQTEACFNHAQAFHLGEDVAKNQELAVVSYRKACLGELAPGCLAVAQLCGQNSNLCPPGEAIHALENACAYGAKDGCVALAQSTLTGAEGAPSLTDLVASFGKGCAQKAQHPCAGLYALAVGKLKTAQVEDQGFARRALSAACKGDYLLACVNLGIMEIRGDGGLKNPAQAQARFKRACEGGVNQACDLFDRLVQERRP